MSSEFVLEGRNISKSFREGEHEVRVLQGVNLQVMERFNAEGIEFAFPTQTVHLAGAGNPPTDPRRMDEGLGGGQLPTSQPREE